MIDDYIRSQDDVLSTKGKGLLERLHTILDTSMENAAPTPQAAARIRKLNAGYKIHKELMETESAVAAMRRGDYDPEVLVSKFFRPGVVTPTKELMRAIPQDQKKKLLPYIQRKSIQNLFDDETKIIEGVEYTNAANVDRKFRKAREALATHMTPEQMNGIREFIDASKVAQSSSQMMNRASGRQLLTWNQAGQAGLALYFAAQGDWAGMGGAGLVTVGPVALSRLLTQPGAAKMLAKGLTISRRQAEATGFVPRLANLIRLNQDTSDEEPKE
jgi:hypothetical protein